MTVLKLDSTGLGPFPSISAWEAPFVLQTNSDIFYSTKSSRFALTFLPFLWTTFLLGGRRY